MEATGILVEAPIAGNKGPLLEDGAVGEGERESGWGGGGARHYGVQSIRTECR